MAAKGDVELIIRAKNEATKNLDQINKSLKDLADQQAIVGDSAGKADDQLGRLGLELAKLRTNAQNLKALSTVGDVLDKATLAMQRQRAAAEQAATELAKTSARQQELAGQSTELATSLKATTAEVKQQEAALKSARSSLTTLGKETTSLANQEKSLESAIASAGASLQKRQTALDAAAKKQAELTAALSSTEKVTKAQQNSLDAANRTLERRKTAVDEVVAKEAQLRQELGQVRSAMSENTAAVLNANSALTQQVARTNEAQIAATKLKVEADGLAKAERAIVNDVKAATGAVEQQANALKTVETEYSQVQAAAQAARTAVAGSADASKDAGAAAGRAAVQVATFAARLAVLAGVGSGSSSKPVIIDPAAVRAADGELARLGVTIRAAGNEAAKASISSKEMEAALKGVGEAKSTLTGIQAAISSQGAAVDGAKNAWKAAEAEVRRLALALRGTAEPSDALAAALGKSQGAARLAKDEFLKQNAAADKLAASLQSAGMGSGTLNSAAAALGPSIQRASSLMAQGATNAAKLAGATANVGSSASSATPQVGKLATAIGTMVSAANRAASATNPLRAFKNELVAMVAASAGLYAIKEQLVSIWDAGAALQGNQMKFATAFSGVAEGAKELEYARSVALNLKLPLDTLTKSYADLALSAKGTSMEGQGARDVFVAFAQTARVNQTSAESLEGTYKALTQIMSKGKVQAEELRQQLGDRLPGAMQLMAQGLGVTTEKLDQMMEKGELTRETLLNMAAAASERVAPQLSAALDSPAAKLADFQNRLLIFKETVAGSGFLDAIADAFDRMAKALSTPEAIQGARDLGQALADLVTWLVEASQHMDTIIGVIKGLGVAWVALQIGSIVSGLYGFVAAIGATAVAVLGLDIALAPVLVGLAALSAVVATVVGAFGLWKLAEWAYNNFPAFAEGLLSIKNAALQTWDGIMQAWEITGVRLMNSFAKVTAQIADMWYGMLDKVVNAFPELNATLGIGDFGADIAKKAADAAAALQSNEANLQANIDEIRARYAGKEQERQQQLSDDIADYHRARIADARAESGQIDPAKRRGGKPIGETMGGGPGTELITADPFVPSTAAADDAAAKKAATARIALEQQVANQMFSIREQLERKSAETTDERIAAVPAKYAKLYGQLTALGKDRTSEEWKTVDALVAQEQANIRAADAKKASVAAAKQEREATEAETRSRKEGMDLINTLLQTRKNIQEQIKRAEESGDTIAVEALKQNLATVTEEANEAIAGMLAFWQAVGGPQADAAIAKLESAKLTLTRVKDEGILTGQNIGKTFANTAKNGVDTFIDKVSETGNVFESAKEAFLAFAADFLKQIAKMILQQLLFNAIKAGLSAIGGGGAIGAGMSSTMASQYHGGGTVGIGGTPRRVNPAIFANAARFHGGGIPGLKRNEVPAVLEAGEVVRTEQQEKALADRQAMLESGASGGESAPRVDLKIVNAIDSASVLSEGLSTVTGQQVFMNYLRANKGKIQGILN